MYNLNKFSEKERWNRFLQILLEDYKPDLVYLAIQQALDKYSHEEWEYVGVNRCMNYIRGILKRETVDEEVKRQREKSILSHPKTNVV